MPQRVRQAFQPRLAIAQRNQLVSGSHGSAIAALIAAFAGLAADGARADAWLDTGNADLRGDLQLLSDRGVIDLPLTAWPIPTVDLARALASVADDDALSASEASAIGRLRQHVGRLQRDPIRVGVRVSGSAKPLQIRSFDDVPREEGEVSGHVTHAGATWSARLSGTVVVDPDDGQRFRLDGTYGSFRLGNWLVTAGALDRWWGPGWDGSLILSSNARPVPALSLDRESSETFESPWLSWLGPWRLSAFMGQMEQEREDRDHPLLFGMRLTFRPFHDFEVGSVRPFRGLEFALERTAQWCGEGLPCGSKAFWNMFTGDDSQGDTVELEEEPGNQLAGWTLRWASPLKNVPLAVYRQRTGESIHSPDYSLGQSLTLWGVESWGGTDAGLTWRVVWEYAATSCGEPIPAPFFDCAYTNHLFPVEGYRYRGRSLGHSIDGDGRQRSVQVRVATPRRLHLALLAHWGELNRGGVVPDPVHSITDRPQDFRDLEAIITVPTDRGRWRVSVGGQEIEDQATGRRERAGRGFVEWLLAF